MSTVDLQEQVLACRRSNRRLNLKLARLTQMMLEVKEALSDKIAYDLMLCRQIQSEHNRVDAISDNLYTALKYLMEGFQVQQKMLLDLHSRVEELETATEGKTTTD